MCNDCGYYPACHGNRNRLNHFMPPPPVIRPITDYMAKFICRMGKGAKCCVFLVIGSTGFECIKYYPQLRDQLKRDKINAQAEGGWLGCHWDTVTDDL